MTIPLLVQLRQILGYLIIVAVGVAVFFKLPVTFCSIQLGYLQLICPVGFIETSIATKSIIIKMLPGVLLVLFFSLLLGRSFCSWACPARHAGKGARSLVRRKLPGLTTVIINIWMKLKGKVQKRVTLTAGDGLAIMAGGLVAIWWFDFPAYSLFCPVGVLSRNIIELITHLHLRFDLVFLVLPLVLGLMFKTGWKCACPMGLVRGLAATPNRSLQPVIDYNSCVLCNKCMQNCAFGVNLHADIFDSFSCSKCLNCLRDCDYGAIKLKFFNLASSENQQKKATLDLTQRRTFPLDREIIADVRKKHS